MIKKIFSFLSVSLVLSLGISGISFGSSLEDQGYLVSSNDHISNISLRPSTFYPGKDDEIRIKFDIKIALEKLEIYAVRGSEEVEVFSEYDVSKDSGFEVLWDGTDEDGDFLDAGNYRLEFRSRTVSDSLICGRTIEFKYEKPRINYLYLSKSSFDHEAGEFSYVIFQTDSDGMVDVEAILDNDDEEYIAEEISVEKNKWYALIFDGLDFDYGDNLAIRVKAYNEANDSVYNTKSIKVNLAEERNSSSKANIVFDYLAPVISDGSDKLTLNYKIENDGDLSVSIYKGTNSTGTRIDEIISIKDQKSGFHSISFDAVSSSGTRLSKGVYNYKITSKKTSSDIESGIFVIGLVGEYDEVNSSSISKPTNQSGKISKNVIIDGVSYSQNTGANCSGFRDVSESSKYCDAISWAKDSGIFNGYSDFTFRPNDPINRVEILKTIIEANRLMTVKDDSGNAGFSDVYAGEWYVRYIKSGLIYGIFSGDAGKNTARPSDFVNRVEALKLVFEAKSVNGGYSYSNCYDSIYNDVSNYSWYFKYVCESKKLSLFEPFSNNFHPGILASRGEIAHILYKMR